MPSLYDRELGELGVTYSLARSADISALKVGIVNASEASILSVGSGGSFTVASVLCTLHEAYTGRVSRPSTPLEIISNPTLAASSPIFFVSAEGKNPDIVEALLRARRHSARDLHVITNRSASPLCDAVDKLTDVRVHTFELATKDGYLATNSLILDATLVVRAYEELDNHGDEIPGVIEELELANGSIGHWISSAQEFAKIASRRLGVIVLFSPALKAVATDLESKLSESALFFCQIADLRSFAHGRHLWLADRASEIVVFALVDPSNEPLWDATRALLPSDIVALTLKVRDAKPRSLLAALIAELQLVASLANAKQKDPARPHVQDFARELYYIDLPKLVEHPSAEIDSAELAKFSVLGAHWPSISQVAPMRRTSAAAKEALSTRTFRAAIFDYDGTLSSSNRREFPPSEEICAELTRLVDHGINVGIASGRGDSIMVQLKKALPEKYWSKIHLGLFSCGWIGPLSAEVPNSALTSEYLNHVKRIVLNLQHTGVPIDRVRDYYNYQVSIRFRPGIDALGMWFVVVDALRQAGVSDANVVRSRHSVDVLGPGISKSKLVNHIAQENAIDPYEILTFGDQGAWPGNDSSLLDHKYSLSVATPSRKLDRGWKFAPAHKRDVDATLWYLRSAKLVDGAKFCIGL